MEGLCVTRSTALVSIKWWIQGASRLATSRILFRSPPRRIYRRAKLANPARPQRRVVHLVFSPPLIPPCFPGFPFRFPQTMFACITCEHRAYDGACDNGEQPAGIAFVIQRV